VVFFSAAVIFVFLPFFADSGEHAVVQALLIGSVIAVLVMTMFVLRVLDDPYHPGLGSRRPLAMERSLDVLQEAGARSST
jgi:RsiW-degrading membrane proteinase PrsW (M82 family)